MIMGIDPDKGIAIKTSGSNNYVFIKTVKGIAEMLPLISQLVDLYKIDKIIIEKPKSSHVYQRSGCNQWAMMKIARNVERNLMKAEEIVRYCKDLGKCEVVTGSIPKGYGKLSQVDFERYTGCKMRMSSHARDAAMMIWGM